MQIHRDSQPEMGRIGSYVEATVGIGGAAVFGALTATISGESTFANIMEGIGLVGFTIVSANLAWDGIRNIATHAMLARQQG